MVLKNKSGISHAQDLQVVIVVSGVKGYQNDVTTIVWDKVYELQNGTLEFQTPEKMTKELIIQDAVNDNNPIIQKRHQNDFNFLNNTFESAFFVFLWSIMNWLSNNMEFMKFISETVTRKALQMSCWNWHQNCLKNPNVLIIWILVYFCIVISLFWIFVLKWNWCWSFLYDHY